MDEFPYDAAAPSAAAAAAVFEELCDPEGCAEPPSPPPKPHARCLPRGSGGVTLFRERLTRYRRLRTELEPWSDSFTARAGRRPNLKDIRSSGVPWLVESFQEYVALRDTLVADVPHLRGAIASEARRVLTPVSYSTAAPANNPLGRLHRQS